MMLILRKLTKLSAPLTISKSEKLLSHLTFDREAVMALSEQDIYDQKWAVVPPVMMSEVIH